MVERWLDVLKRADEEPENVFYPLAQACPTASSQ